MSGKKRGEKSRYEVPNGFDNLGDFLTYCAVRRDPYFKIGHANFLYELAGRSKLTVRSINQVVLIYEPEMNDLLRIISKKRNPRTK